MKLYSLLKLSHANTIIILKNKGLSMYQINKITGISKGKIKRCLDSCKIVKIKDNIQKPRKGPHVKIFYSFKLYKNNQNWIKMNKGFNYAQEAETIYKPFIEFCNDLYNKKILKKK